MTPKSKEQQSYLQQYKSPSTTKSNSIPTTTTKKITVSMPPPHTAPNDYEGAKSRQQYPQYKIP